MNTEMESIYSNQLWTGRKPSLGHVRIWGSLTHVLKRDPSKLKTRSIVCLFMGYPKGTKGYMFYDPQDQKVFVSTNARFLEEDHMIDNKPRSKIILEEMREEDGNDPVPIRPTRVEVHKIEESLVIVGGLSCNLIISLV